MEFLVEGTFSQRNNLAEKSRYFLNPFPKIVVVAVVAVVTVVVIFEKRCQSF
jgi:hypothetical protein